MTAYPFARCTSDWPTADSLDQHEAGRGDLHISNDIWIRCGATANFRVKIRDSLSTCTGSVVTKNVEDFAVVAGNPARFIKYRFDEVTRTWLSDLAWWDWSEDKVARNVDKSMKPPTDNDFEIIEYQQRRIIKI